MTQKNIKNRQQSSLASYLQNIFQNLEQVDSNALGSKIDIELCLDESGNVISESNNKITLHYAYLPLLEGQEGA